MQVGRLRTMGLAKEGSVGSLTVPPTEFLRFIPPDGFYPKIALLVEKSLGSLPDFNIKQSQGPGTLNGLKLDLEAEPENIGHILQACFGLDALTGPTNTTVYTHTFVRQAVSQLPTYTFWFDKSPLFPQFTGCMLGKLDIEVKAKELVKFMTEWEALSYDTTGITHAPSYSNVRPFVFNQAVVKVGGSSITNYDNLKISINNMVKTDHVLSGSIYPGKVYSEGMDVEVSADLFFENATEYNNFLANTTTSFELILTHSDTIPGSSGSIPYSLDITIPVVAYKSASLPIPSGVLKVAFTGAAMYDTGTTKTINAVLKNGVSSAY